MVAYPTAISDLFPVVSSISPNLLLIAISITPRSRDWIFSSVTSAPRPANTPAKDPATAALAASIETSSSRHPSAAATAAASSKLSAEVNSEGSITHRTFPAPTASQAIAATSALSTPPDSPSSTRLNPDFPR